MAMVTLRLDDELNELLNAAAKRTGESKSAIIKGVLRANRAEIDELQPMSVRIAEYRKEKAEGTLETMTFDEFKQSLPEIFYPTEKTISEKPSRSAKKDKGTDR